MVSAIDPTVPVFGSPTTASVRSNFLIAKNEITALQAAVGVTLPLPITSGGTGATSAVAALTNLGAVPLAGGSMTGLLRLSGNPTDILGATPKQYVDAYFPVAIANGGTGANNATQALLNLGAVGVNSPQFTGIPTAPTAPTSDASTTLATTAFVHNVLGGTSIVNNVSGGNGITVSPNIGNVVVALSAPVTIANGGTGAGTAAAALAALGGAPIASPTFTGVPSGPTAAPGVNTTQLATTAYVLAAVQAGTTGVTFLSGGNGITVNQNTGAVQVSLTSPVTVINGGTGANSGNAGLDNLLGVGANANGVVTRQSNGAYTLAQVLGQFIGDSPPTTPIIGQLWWDSIGGQLYIFYNDGNSSQWVISNNNTAGAGTYLPLNGGTLTGPLVIGTPQPAPTSQISVAGADSTSSQITVSAYGTGIQPFFTARRGRGTSAAPTAVQTADVLGTFAVNGWAATANAFGGQLNYYARENWTATANGSALQIQTVGVGTTTSLVRMEVDNGVVIGNQAADPGQGGLVLNANAAVPQAASFAPNEWIAAADGQAPAVLLDGYNGSPFIFGRRARGTAAAPTATGAGDQLLNMIGAGRTATGYSGGRANIVFLTTEAWSDTANGCQINFGATPTGSATEITAAIFNANTGCQLLGTQTNDNAQAGWIGEYAQAQILWSARTNTPATGVAGNLLTLSLTAGDWDVSANVYFSLSGVTSTSAQAGISTTSASMPDPNLQARVVANGQDAASPVVPQRVSLAATTTIYLVIIATYSVGQAQASGILRARRVR